MNADARRTIVTTKLVVSTLRAVTVVCAKSIGWAMDGIATENCYANPENTTATS